MKKAIFILIMIFPAWSWAGQQEDCKATYDPATGRAILPCVEAQDGTWYGVELQRQQDLVFSAFSVEHLLPASGDVKSIRIIETESGTNPPTPERWLFIQIIVPDCNNFHSGFTLTTLPSEDPNGRGKIDVTIVGFFVPNGCTIKLPLTSIADVIDEPLESGPYDIYVNGELKASVEVPGPGS